jgi:hypothetical protein
VLRQKRFHNPHSGRTRDFKVLEGRETSATRIALAVRLIQSQRGDSPKRHVFGYQRNTEDHRLAGRLTRSACAPSATAAISSNRPYVYHDGVISFSANDSSESSAAPPHSSRRLRILRDASAFIATPPHSSRRLRILRGVSAFIATPPHSLRRLRILRGVSAFIATPPHSLRRHFSVGIDAFFVNCAP